MHGTAAQSLALALGIGALVTLVCRRLRFPPILPLLACGVILGTSGLRFVDADSLGGGLNAFITLAVSLLIFEGALHLDRRTLRRAPNAVIGLLTIGALVTWALAAVCAHYVVGLAWSTSLLLGAMLIVTGPTVVQPILRRLPLRPNLNVALLTEGILIDPIGAVAAATTLELVRATYEGRGAPPLESAWLFLEPALAGAVFGLGFGFLAVVLLKRFNTGSGQDPAKLTLIGVGACAGAVGFSEMASPEAGLVAAAFCGVVIANFRIAGAEDLHRFKEQVSLFLVGMLFILLAARFELEKLSRVGLPEIVFLVLIILLVRPLSVLAATTRSILTWRERAFTAFLAPRGIVAASLASIAALQLVAIAETPEISGSVAERLLREADAIETLVFLVIASTVLLAGALSAPVANLLGVRAPAPTGLLIVGGGRLGRELALALFRQDIRVHLVDTNAEALAAAAAWNLPTYLGDATDAGWLEETLPLNSIGWVITATENTAVDAVVARWARNRFGDDRAFRWFETHPGEGDPGIPLPHYGRPLRHLLFQMDMEAARVETWTEPRDDAVPFALVHKKRLALLPEGWDQQELPEGGVLVGIVFGPRPREQTRQGGEPTSPDAPLSDGP